MYLLYVLVSGAIFAVSESWPNSQNRDAARAQVESCYVNGPAEAFSGCSLWMRNDYEREWPPKSWRILSVHQGISHDDYDVEVEVDRGTRRTKDRLHVRSFAQQDNMGQAVFVTEFSSIPM